MQQENSHQITAGDMWHRVISGGVIPCQSARNCFKYYNLWKMNDGHKAAIFVHFLHQNAITTHETCTKQEYNILIRLPLTVGNCTLIDDFSPWVFTRHDQLNTIKTQDFDCRKINFWIWSQDSNKRFSLLWFGNFLIAKSEILQKSARLPPIMFVIKSCQFHENIFLIGKQLDAAVPLAEMCSAAALNQVFKVSVFSFLNLIRLSYLKI